MLVRWEYLGFRIRDRYALGGVIGMICELFFFFIISVMHCGILGKIIIQPFSLLFDRSVNSQCIVSYGPFGSETLAGLGIATGKNGSTTQNFW
jgi:hypothetical protein